MVVIMVIIMVAPVKAAWCCVRVAALHRAVRE